MGFDLPLYPSGSPLGSEVFLGCSSSTAFAVSIYPLLAFRPLSEDEPGDHRLGHIIVHAPCRRLRLAALSFASLQHLPELGVHVSRGCLSLFVALSGFDYPLSGFLLPKPLSPVSDSSVPGISPFRVFLPSKSRFPLENSLLSWRWIEQKNQKVVSLIPRLQSVAPFEEASSLAFYR
jgi:hypothetical protein